MEVVGPHPQAQEALVEIEDGPRRRVEPAQQHALVLHRHAGIDQQPARPRGLGRQLAGVVEVGDHVEWRESAQERSQRGGHAHRAGHRDAGAEADHLYRRDRRDLGEQLLEPGVGEQEGVAARDQHVAHLGVLAQVGDGLAQGRAIELALTAAGEPAPRAVAAVDRAAIGGQEQHAVGIPMHDGRRRAGQVLLQRVRELPGPDQRLVGQRDGLPSNRAERVPPIDQREVVGRDAESEDLRRGGDALAFVGTERQAALELLGVPTMFRACQRQSPHSASLASG